MSISYYTERVHLPKKFKKRPTTQWIKDIIQNHEKQLGSIVYIFCNDEIILEINQQYLQSDYYTDIITFDYSESAVLSGDIYISLDTVKSNSEKFNTNFLEEIHRVIIHGILHLCGYKDKTPKEQKMMRAKEDEALQLFESGL
jgi:rRNA maturation RNase YbeY